MTHIGLYFSKHSSFRKFLIFLERKGAAEFIEVGVTEEGRPGVNS